MSYELHGNGLAWTEGPEIEFQDADGFWTDENEAALNEAVRSTPTLRGFACPLCGQGVFGFNQEAIVNADATANRAFVQRSHSGLTLVTLKPCGHTFRKTS